MFIKSHYSYFEHESRSGLFIIGILLFVFGMSAILLPYVVSVATGVLIGCLLLISGLVGAGFAWQARTAAHFNWRLSGAVAAALGGIALMVFPSVGALTLTLLIGVYFVFSGANKTAVALNLSRRSAGRWLLLSGLLDLLLGLFIVLNWTAVAAWILGLMVGVSLMLHGWWFIRLSRSTEKELV